MQQLPPDALGFAVVREIGATNGKLQQLSAALQVRAFGPLEFLRTATGIGKALDRDGDFLLAVVPTDASGGQVKFCVWLPTNDYDRLLATLGTNPAPGITAISIAGEDLLIARHEKWAIVMDPDQRERMELMLAATQPPAIASPWQEIVDTNDITMVAFSGGVQELLRIVAANQLDELPADSVDAGDDLFGNAQGANANPPPKDRANNSATGGIIAVLGRFVSNLRIAVPELSNPINELQSLGIGLRIDNEQNALASVRTIWQGGERVPTQVEPAIAASEHAPALLHEGEFILHGAANLPPALAAEAATSYVRWQVNELTSGEQIRLDEKSLARFYDAVRQASSETTAASALTLPGEKDDGVYTNSFLAVRVTSADKFVDLATEAMRLWNQMNRDGQGGPRLVFDVEELSLGDPPRRVIQYSLDLAAADGAPMLPETRQAMEKLFGPGGKLRLLIAKIDNHTALLAGATPDQATAMLETLDRKQPLDWRQPPLRDVNRLLPPRADWRAFFSPHGYTAWKSRESAAIIGTEVIGGPIVREFPAAPPIGIAGGVNNGELWVDIVMPADTIRGAGVYLQPKRRNP